MAFEASSASPDPDEPSLSVAGVRLLDLVDQAGPFGSLFVSGGSGLRARAQFALDAVPVPAPYSGAMLGAVEDSQARSQVIVSNADSVWRFLLEDPLAADLARFGDIPSLGPIIEAAQVTTPHAVVTIEDDVYGVTSFGSVDSAPTSSDEAPTEPSILEALDQLVEVLRSSHVRLVGLLGSEAAIGELQGHLQNELPLLRCNAYPTDDIDRDLLSIADEVVRDAASLAAERRTHELAHFRQSRTAAQTQEGVAVIGALDAGGAQRLLVHDDLAATEQPGVTRLADRAIVAAIRAGVPITMIPKVPGDRGPKDGLGVIMKGHGNAVSSASGQPQITDDVQLRL